MKTKFRQYRDGILLRRYRCLRKVVCHILAVRREKGVTRGYLLLKMLHFLTQVCFSMPSLEHSSYVTSREVYHFLENKGSFAKSERDFYIVIGLSSRKRYRGYVKDSDRVSGILLD